MASVWHVSGICPDGLRAGGALTLGDESGDDRCRPLEIKVSLANSHGGKLSMKETHLIMNNGKSFESQVADFYRATISNNPASIVSQNQRILGPDGDREFDVVIVTQVADISLTTVIECKDYGRLVNVTTVDAFASKLEDIRAAKGILVSRKGFTKSAVDKAKRLNISVCTLDHAESLAKDSELNVPILFRKIQFGTIGATFRPSKTGFGSAMRIDANAFVCDVGLMDIVKEVDPNIIIRNQNLEVNLSDLWGGRELWYRNSEGEKLGLSYCKLDFELLGPVSFGYLSDLPSSMYKRDEISKDASMVFDLSDFRKVEESLRVYRTYEDVPDYAKSFFLAAVVCPDRVESLGKVSLFGYKN